jgi:uracil-DNA glycosylase
MSNGYQKQNNINSSINELLDQHTEINSYIDELLSEINELNKSDTTYLVNLLVNSNIHKSWYELFLQTSNLLTNTMKQVDQSRLSNTVFPPPELTFKVFESDINSIKIVLIGQDPYIKKGQAMGLSFSVPDDVVQPPSLYNIFKEIKTEFPDRKYKFDKSGNLTKWFESGVFLLNSALTVIEGKSNSQQGIWTQFTDEVIKYIDSKKSNVVFLLLGSNAIGKKYYINSNNNHIVTGVHPSPLSAYNGFFNSGIFIKVEEKLGEPFEWLNY